jgi:hypothetical protein
MDFSTLADFRRKAYGCFERAADALMNVSDALLTETPARSLAELSLSPYFTRRWPSIYAALQDAKIDRSALQKLFVHYAPLPQEGERLVLGGDASSILRVQSPSARDRTYVHASNLPEGTKPVRAGWQFSELAVLPAEQSSFVYVLDNRRIESSSTQGQVMAAQLRETVARGVGRFLFLGDGYYGSQTFRSLTADIACDVLVRFAKNRVLYREPPPVSPKPGPGHPTWHGAPLRFGDPTTHGTPDQQWEGTDAKGHWGEVRCWHNLHFAKAHHQQVSLFQVIRDGAKDTKRDPKVSWFVFWGVSAPPPAAVPVLYTRRYNLEQGYRTAKQDLLWETPRLRTPEQFERWTDVVSLVRNTLFLARDLVATQRQPWESTRRPRTPKQVRRAMRPIIARLGTPARVCQPRGYSPGWPSGRSRKPVATYKVVFKACQTAEKRAKRRPKALHMASVAI